MSTSDEQDHKVRQALDLVFDVQREIDRIFAECPDAYLVIPQVADGKLVFLVLDEIDAGL